MATNAAAVDTYGFVGRDLYPSKDDVEFVGAVEKRSVELMGHEIERVKEMKLNTENIRLVIEVPRADPAPRPRYCEGARKQLAREPDVDRACNVELDHVHGVWRLPSRRSAPSA